MKTRQFFVSNSSSLSFIVASKLKDLAIKIEIKLSEFTELVISNEEGL